MHANNLKAAIVLSVGLVVSSIIFGLAFCYTRSTTTAYVSVKGLAEREVDANFGIWLTYRHLMMLPFLYLFNIVVKKSFILHFWLDQAKKSSADEKSGISFLFWGSV